MSESFTIEQIRVEGSICFSQIESLAIHESVNEHGTMEVSGVVADASGLMDGSLRDGCLTVLAGGRERPLFTGVIEEVRITDDRGVSRVVAICSSFTVLLDWKLRSRSFQDTDLRYRDILMRAGKDGDGKARILVTSERAKGRIGVPVVQYRETDWEFIRRIAGRLRTVVMPEVTYAMPQLSVGCVEGGCYRLEGV